MPSASSALDLPLALAAVTGHLALVVYLFNRLHAVAWPRWALKVAERGLLLGACLLALAYLLSSQVMFSAVYSATGWLAAAATIPCWLIPKLCERSPAALTSNDTTYIDVKQRLGRAPVCGTMARWLACFPGNGQLRIAVQQKTVRVANLPHSLAGLRIAHLSDLHMTGKLDRAFYDLVVDETNALAPDLVCLTGDILEKQRCLPWIEPTLGRLRARHGTYFILGNHELKLGDVRPLRQALTGCGCVDLGGRTARISIDQTEILLAGNELPWFAPREDFNSEFRIQNSENNNKLASNSEFCIVNSAFKILLAHTPDQLPWARRRAFDLMLAGHNHGGQIRLPYLGALITPSWYGSRFAGGLYDQPPTLLHVSRGLAGDIPLRLNCPPEIALLILQPTG